MFVIPNANTLLTYIKDFTGSSDDNEIKQCIFMAELSMRNIELPVLRSDPYDADYIATADAQGRVPIPGDMNQQFTEETLVKLEQIMNLHLHLEQAHKLTCITTELGHYCLLRY